MRLERSKRTAGKSGARLKYCIIGVLCAALFNLYFQASMVDLRSVSDNSTQNDIAHNSFVSNGNNSNAHDKRKQNGESGPVDDDGDDGDDDKSNDDDDHHDDGDGDGDDNSNNNNNNSVRGNETSNNETDIKNEKPHLQSLQCEAYGGPSVDIASEMVYWWKIPSDEKYLNMFQKMHLKEKEEKYLIFEPDAAGFNNIR